MSVAVKDGYEVTSKSIESKISEQKKGGLEEKFLKKLKEEQLKLHLKRQDEAKQTLTPEQIKEQEKIWQELVAEKSLREQEEKQREKVEQEKVQINKTINLTTVTNIEFIEQKQFNLGPQPTTLTSNVQAVNLKTQEVAKYHGNNNDGNIMGG